LPFLLLSALVFNKELGAKGGFVFKVISVVVGKIAINMVLSLGVVLLGIILGFCSIILGIKLGLGVILLELSNYSSALPF
jgi:hypothetical protein